MIIVMEKDRTADEWGQLQVLCEYAELDFIREERPALAKRAHDRVKRYAAETICARFRENGISTPSPKSVEHYYQKSCDAIALMYQLWLKKYQVSSL